MTSSSADMDYGTRHSWTCDQLVTAVQHNEAALNQLHLDKTRYTAQRQLALEELRNRLGDAASDDI